MPLPFPESNLRRPWSARHLRFHAFPVTAETGGGSAPPALKVLLVDDHEDTNRSLVLLLGRRGYKVQSATSLAEAKVKCDLEAFDALVCDMHLPDGSGLDLLGLLGDRVPRLGGIILSGYSAQEDAARSLAAGYKAHLGKPVEITRLDTAIRQLGQ